MFLAFIKMLQLAWALDPELLQIMFRFCAMRSEANLSRQVLICAYIDLGIYVYTYILYIYTYTSSYGVARGLGSDVEGLDHMLVLMGEELPLRRNQNKK
jgi:hypothetical protein